ncbi:hypothetical protein F2Q69_00016279 [Brassica cretica]|uniref:Uncharacterized protein n=1 Tax=Brassica cretica TaxID=69181 RepID=A0A8S9R9F8_BRACR|nr:hypothetical protein F2Q69_00016279 [Brassica cretica]
MELAFSVRIDYTLSLHVLKLKGGRAYLYKTTTNQLQVGGSQCVASHGSGRMRGGTSCSTWLAACPGHMQDTTTPPRLSIYISGKFSIISVDSILIFLFPVEFPVTIKVISSFAEFWLSGDRWDVYVDRWMGCMAISLFEAVFYTTSCAIELLCSLLFSVAALMHEQIVCSIGFLKDNCDIFSRHV